MRSPPIESYLDFRFFLYKNADHPINMSSIVDAPEGNTQEKDTANPILSYQKTRNTTEVSRNLNLRSRHYSNSSTSPPTFTLNPEPNNRVPANSSSSHLQRVTLLTLPRVELWCRDGLCYPYYKDPRKKAHLSKNGKSLRQGNLHSTARVQPAKVYKMPTVITTNMKNNEQLDPAILLQKSLEQSRRLKNTSNENNLVSANMIKNSTGDVYKHKIRVNNYPASDSVYHDNNSAKVNAIGPGSAYDKRSRSCGTNNSDRVTLTIGNYLQEDDPSYNYSTGSIGSSGSDGRSAATTASSIDLDDFHPVTIKDQQRVNSRIPSNYERNITRCSLGPVNNPMSVMTINNDVSATTDKMPHNNDGQYNVSVSSLSTDTDTVGDHVKTDDSPFAQALGTSTPFCPSCNGIAPCNDVIPELPQATKVEPGFWNSTNTFHSTLHREASFHSCGGFTLNGQPGHLKPKRGKMSRICSSHKVAFVVSTFSLLVTIGLIITLLLMKKKGMMEAMR